MTGKLTIGISNPKDLAPFSKEAVLNDFKICCISREASLMGRKEVLTGKAKFGIFGGGKEVAQVALAYNFLPGDFRAGYYRDQTLMFALGIAELESFFAQLYADTENDPYSGGRQMNNHYATPFVDKNGEWTDHRSLYNITSDTSNTAGQMARALGLALASKFYRNDPDLSDSTRFSKNGNEICFCTIGDGSTSEGIFWETMNAAAVLKVPLATFVWDDGYGISVPTEYQTVKSSISQALSGFQLNEKQDGMRVFNAKGWDYPNLVQLFSTEIEKIRIEHIPALFHIDEITQPQGHSTSGSQERYKSKERLEWEKEQDCLVKMEAWMIKEGYATEEECQEMRAQAKKTVKIARDKAWKAFVEPTKAKLKELKAIFQRIEGHDSIKQDLNNLINPFLSEILVQAKRMSFDIARTQNALPGELKAWIKTVEKKGPEKYHTFLYSQSPYSALRVPVIHPKFSSKSPLVNGYEILNAFFDSTLKKRPEFCAFGEDVGKIGDVNQGFAGLQKKYGEKRVFDTGIREWTIIGQGIGMAMRGLRPIAEVQYLDYLIYGLEPLMDDLATLRWRSNNLQQSPMIIRTRGHRLEGIWHSGSPMGMIINSIKGIYVCVPRNMTQAAGMYNTLLQSDDPGLVIESLNGYRLKEKLPDNMGEYTVPLGVPEIVREGKDITLVTYGSCVRIAEEAAKLLAIHNIALEIIDVQTLIPFDLEHRIVESLKKTNRIIFLDEDYPGGASGFMMQQVLVEQNGYFYLDTKPVTLTAKEHRPAYGTDGDYFSKPNVEDIFEACYKIMAEFQPNQFNRNLIQ